jgi:4-amino-4-deoxy-L-arabinose transferase-like glycosyltransferase
VQQLVRHQLIIVAAACVVFLTNLGAAQLFDEDEPKNAACAQEMLARGDWVVPTFNGELRTDKPILLYWFTLTAYHVFGVNEFSARLWSAIAGIGTVLLTYHIGRRAFSAEVGFWAGLLLCCSLMFTVASRAATPDALLIFFSTLAVWFFVAGTFSPNSASDGLPSQPRTYVLMYAAMGVAVLAKGPIGLLLPTAVIGAYLLSLNAVPRVEVHADTRLERGTLAVILWLVRTFWPRRIVEFAWRLRPLTALAIVAAVALPWYVVVGIQTGGEWPLGFLWKHNVGRYLEPMEGHSGPPMFYVMSIFVGFFPASLFLMPALVDSRRYLRDGGPSRAGYLLALSWVAVYVVFFTFAGTKLPSYVTPTHPALAMLTAAFFCRWAREPALVRVFWQRFPLAMLGTVGVGVTIGLGWAANRFLGGEALVGLIGLILLAGAAACLWLVRRGEISNVRSVFVASAIAFLACGFGWVTTRIAPYQVGGHMAETIRRQSPDGTAANVVAFRAFRPSWVFYTNQRVELLREPDEVNALFRRDQNSFVITDWRKLDELLPLLPEHIEVLSRHPRFLRKGEIVVLGSRKRSGFGEYDSEGTRTARRLSKSSQR